MNSDRMMIHKYPKQKLPKNITALAVVINSLQDFINRIKEISHGKN